MSIPAFVIEIYQNFKLDKVLVWLKEYLKFFLNPKHFYRNLFSRNNTEQGYQISFYILTFIFILSILNEKCSLKSNYKLAIDMLILSIPFTILNSITFSIFYPKFSKYKILIGNFLVWTLFGILGFILLFVRPKLALGRRQGGMGENTHNGG